MKKILSLIFFGIFLVSANFVYAAELGEQVKFFVDSGYDAYKRSELTATLRLKSGQAYFYVDDNYWNQMTPTNRDIFLANLGTLANEFDLVIYPKERTFFGSEWNPGIDNDKRITILVLPLIDSAGGYFNSNDEYSRSVFFNSNQREMIYLNALFAKKPEAKSFLAHEFQHLITFYQKTVLYNLEEDIWLNEARSEYAPTLLGYDNVYPGSSLEKRTELFLDSPSDSLTEWNNKIDDYGPVNLFFQYLIDHYGKNVLARMVLNNQVGLASLNLALTDLGYKETFSDIFADWAIANYLNNCLADLLKKYCYLNNNLTYQRLHVEPTAGYSGFPYLIVSRSGVVKSWAPVWYRFKPQTGAETDKNTLKLEFSGSANFGDFRAPYIIIDNNDQIKVSAISLNKQKGTAYIPNFISLIKSVILIPFNQYKKSGFTANESSIGFSFTASSVSLNEPVIEQITPLSGSINGGFLVTIIGQNFSEETKVKFGQTEVSPVNFINAQTITLTAPAYQAGLVDISVMNPDGGSAVLTSGFTYLSSSTFFLEGSLVRAKGDYRVYIIKGQYKRWVQRAEIFNAYPHLKWSDIIEARPEELAGYQEAWLIRAVNDPRVYEVNGDATKHWLNMTAEDFSRSGRKWEMVYIVNDFERDFYVTGANVMFK